ncbi:MAG: ATP-binding protein, partial [Verrucomicrobiota bacterium]
MLHRILENFLGNARKYTRRGQITLAAGLWQTTDGPTELHLSVRDTGIGIAPDK